jgi:hypothetical protein
MALVRCPGCKKKYENGGSLSAHQRKCVKLEATAKKLVKKRDKNRKREESAKVSRREYSQDDDNVLEMRAEVREHINSFDAEETPSGKRKLGGLNPVSVDYYFPTRMVFFTSIYSNPMPLHK